MMPFTDTEHDFLSTQRLGRVATASASGEPDVAPVGYRVVDGTVRITGMAMEKTRKYHNVKANGRASFVVDDLVSVDPWRPRGLKVAGRAEVLTSDGGDVIVISPETVWSWGLNVGAETVFGPIEKRPF